MDTRKRFALFKIFQLVLGLVTYCAYCGYNANSTVVSDIFRDSNEYFVRMSFGLTTVTAFPFIIVSLTVIVFLTHSQASISVENNLLQFLFSTMGFFMYLTTALMLFYLCGRYRPCTDGVRATAALCSATSVVYLIEVILGAFDRFR